MSEEKKFQNGTLRLYLEVRYDLPFVLDKPATAKELLANGIKHNGGDLYSLVEMVKGEYAAEVHAVMIDSLEGDKISATVFEGTELDALLDDSTAHDGNLIKFNHSSLSEGKKKKLTELFDKGLLDVTVLLPDACFDKEGKRREDMSDMNDADVHVLHLREQTGISKDGYQCDVRLAKANFAVEHMECSDYMTSALADALKVG